MSTTLVSIDSIASFIRERVASYANMPAAEIGLASPLSEYGLDSVSAISLCADLEDRLGIVVEPTVAWDFPTIAEMAAHLQSQVA